MRGADASARTITVDGAVFVRLHQAALCCSRTRVGAASGGELVFAGHGTPLGALGALDAQSAVVLKRGQRTESAAGRSVAHKVPRPEECATPCSKVRRCAFFSHSARSRRCVFCSACTLRNPLSELNASGGYSSWARWNGSSTDFQSASAQKPAVPPPLASLYRVTPSAVSVLSPWYQTEYSTALYGAAHRAPPAETLRLLWPTLLPSAALDAVASVGVCKWESKPPLQPFYTVHDIYANPNEALWVHPTAASHPAPNHSWVEVTHCARPASSKPSSRWKDAVMWLYVAPGSAVSVNVGRTLVLGYAELAALLEPVASARREAVAMAGGVCGATSAVSAAGGAADSGFIGNDALPEELRGYDSVQVVEHLEVMSLSIPGAARKRGAHTARARNPAPNSERVATPRSSRRAVLLNGGEARAGDAQTL